MIEFYHGGPVGHSASILIALSEKGLEFTGHFIDLARNDQHLPGFRVLNPAGQVPVLVHDGHVLVETFFILQYLDEISGDPVLGGKTPAERYEIQRWGKYTETHIAPNVAILAWSDRNRSGDVRSTDPEFAQIDQLPQERSALWRAALDGSLEESALEPARIAVVSALEQIERSLADTPWLAGADYGLADIVVFPHADRAFALSSRYPELAPGPSTQAWMDRLAERPAVRAIGKTDEMQIATMGPERGRWG